VFERLQKKLINGQILAMNGVNRPHPRPLPAAGGGGGEAISDGDFNLFILAYV